MTHEAVEAEANEQRAREEARNQEERGHAKGVDDEHDDGDADGP
jgi:hypothetical protein